jgi:hypothetical protein
VGSIPLRSKWNGWVETKTGGFSDASAMRVMTKKQQLNNSNLEYITPLENSLVNQYQHLLIMSATMTRQKEWHMGNNAIDPVRTAAGKEWRWLLWWNRMELKLVAWNDCTTGAKCFI